MKKIIFPAMMAAAILSGCSKSDSNDTSTADFETTKNAGISDFVNVVAMPGYAELKAKSEVLSVSIIALNTSSTEANLATAKAAWRDMRSTWENVKAFFLARWKTMIMTLLLIHGR